MWCCLCGGPLHICSPKEEVYTEHGPEMMGFDLNRIGQEYMNWLDDVSIIATADPSPGGERSDLICVLLIE